MKIACCQFDSKWGDVKGNIQTVDSLLEKYNPGDIDILLLPEMAFSGYVFKDIQEIAPYLENAETGPTVSWARRTGKINVIIAIYGDQQKRITEEFIAIRLHCYVIVGYPQKTDKVNYNSVCFVSPNGQLITTYQKSFLYETDENWAAEGPGFVSMAIGGLGKVGLGICMDINPYKFKADFYDYEFANYHLEQSTDIILCSMAWLKSRETEVGQIPSTIKYWATRLLPLHSNAEEGKHTIFAACNRIGSERGSEFAGASCVLDISDENIAILDSINKETGVMVVEV